MNLNGGYAMIKFNSTQEELAVAYKSKRPALFYDENQRAHWAVIEETATESVDEETQEPITIYKYSYRLLDEESGGSGGSTLDDIVDSKGNKRFIEGNLIVKNKPGLTITYNKWSLSGTHLMLVLCIEYDTAAIFEVNEIFATVELPNYIINKIPSGNRIIDTKSPTSYKISNNKIFANFRYNLTRDNNILKITHDSASIDIPEACYSRLQFDLIIDSE